MDLRQIHNFRADEDIGNIRSKLSHSGVLYEDTHFAYSLGDHREWKRPGEICRHPVFIRDTPNRFDALQGQVGNCYLAAAIETLSLNNKLFKHVVPPNQEFGHGYVGAFTFRIWLIGTWYNVVVDDRLPVYRFNQKQCYMYSRSGDVFWASLLEKAYAKVCGNNYDFLAEGYAMTSLQDLSGGMVESVDTQNPPIHTMLMKQYIQNVYTNRGLMIAVTFKSRNGLRKDHAYAITKVVWWSDDNPVFSGLTLVRLMNPWGHTEWTGDYSDHDDYNWKQIDWETISELHIDEDDGEFWMSSYDVVKYFNRITFCHLGPGQYLSRLQAKTEFSSWSTLNEFGEWVKKVSAGGSDLPTRHLNPQYVIYVDCPSREDSCNVVIDITSRSKYDRRIRPLVAFYIYYLTPGSKLSFPLGKDFFKSAEPLIRRPDFTKSNGRSYLTVLPLKGGKYVIVPATWEREGESRFLLRISTQCRSFVLTTYDGQISKSLPSVESNGFDSTDKGLRIVFEDTAPGEGELDCIGLQQTLEKAKNPKRDYWVIFEYILDFIRSVFATSSTLLSKEAGDSGFTRDECRSMVAMLDDDRSGKLGFPEFSNLWKKIQFWTKVFEQHKDEVEGCVKIAQLRDAMSAAGYNINRRTVQILAHAFADDQGNICLTDFILCGVKLETTLTLSQKKGVEDGKEFKLSLEEWVKAALIL